MVKFKSVLLKNSPIPYHLNLLLQIISLHINYVRELMWNSVGQDLVSTILSTNIFYRQPAGTMDFSWPLQRAIGYPNIISQD